MGRLLGDIVDKMVLKTNDIASGGTVKESPKILIHSTHDTALAALTNTLDVFDDRWPGFTASITFELYKYTSKPSMPSTPQEDVSSSDITTRATPNPGLLKSVLSSRFKRRDSPVDYYVRARYQNRNLVLPLCSEEGKHLPGSPEFCTLEAFAERVNELVPHDWDAECSV